MARTTLNPRSVLNAAGSGSVLYPPPDGPAVELVAPEPLALSPFNWSHLFKVIGAPPRREPCPPGTERRTIDGWGIDWGGAHGVDLFRLYGTLFETGVGVPPWAPDHGEADQFSRILYSERELLMMANVATSAAILAGLDWGWRSRQSFFI